MIFGTALISACMLLGYLLGSVLGLLTGVGSDVGGVGFAMVLLLLITSWLKNRNLLEKDIQAGIRYWGGMYIPIVVAMSASQNVVSALSHGGLAILAGVGAVVAIFIILCLLTRTGILK